ncbi:Phosphate-regulating neutral endopeptidase [Strongyloides ratti]|uniref:Phosphate-regulating neutral endopeptidase n=1 Tax=Strongyloides ratti TaxID=34506 RepID=A0A090KXT6_STRRB|nr:Phosphate-regulating neutral endopeptidase [Strongyloides ratti]CEF62325.1 Phosphate-regulating neutral endopeptidase [Strongyloides ratti]
MKLFLIILGISIIFPSLASKKTCEKNFLHEIYAYGDELASESLSQYVNLDVNPCDDFYNYACGTWLNKKDKKVKGEYNFHEHMKDVYNGKFNGKSEAIKKVNEMRKKCNDLGEDYRNDCIKKVDNFGYYAFASFFVRRMKDTLETYTCFKSIKETIRHIKKQFKILLKEKKNLLDKITMKNYLLKIDNMKFEVSDFYLENLRNKTSMEKCYKYFKFSSKKDDVKKMLSNMKNYASFIPSKDKKSKVRCVDFIVNSESNGVKLEFLIDNYAFYLPEMNTLYFNPTICNNRCHNVYYSKLFNYGCSGFTIAHEMFHAFDSEGMNFDYNGKENYDVTTDYSRNIFNNRSKCFVKMYGNKFNNFLTLDEDIADNGGIKIAHRLFIEGKKRLKCSNRVIPKFEKLTQEQLFYINLARSICKNPNENPDKPDDENYEGNPKDFRIWKVLSNSKSFAKAFQCKVGEKMNPKDKCEFW